MAVASALGTVCFPGELPYGSFFFAAVLQLGLPRKAKKGVQGRPGKRAWKAILVVFGRVLTLLGSLWPSGALFIKKNLMKTDYFMFSNQETNEKVPYKVCSEHF